MVKVASLTVEKEGRFYEVEVIDHDKQGEVIEEYEAGNSIWESHMSFPPGHRSAHTFEQMLAFGQSTLSEMAGEHGAVVDEVVRIVDKMGELVGEV